MTAVGRRGRFAQTRPHLVSREKAFHPVTTFRRSQRWPLCPLTLGWTLMTQAPPPFPLNFAGRGALCRDELSHLSAPRMSKDSFGG